MTRAWRRGCLGALLSAALLVLAAPASTARADVLSDTGKCIAGYAKAAMDPETIAKALEFLGQYGYCIGYFADPEFDAMTGALAVAKKLGKFSDVNSCKARDSRSQRNAAIQQLFARHRLADPGA